MKIKDNSVKWGAIKLASLDSALGRMIKDIKLIAWQTIPFLTGELQKETKEEKKGFLKYRILSNTKYASYQERGKRADGSHVVRRYTTPSTGAHFLENSAKKVVKDGINYLRQANKATRL